MSTSALSTARSARWTSMSLGSPHLRRHRPRRPRRPRRHPTHRRHAGPTRPSAVNRASWGPAATTCSRSRARRFTRLKSAPVMVTAAATCSRRRRRRRLRPPPHAARRAYCPRARPTARSSPAPSPPAWA
eukprot:5031889-Prymnesium_polylepis.1